MGIAVVTARSMNDLNAASSSGVMAVSEILIGNLKIERLITSLTFAPRSNFSSRNLSSSSSLRIWSSTWSVHSIALPLYQARRPGENLVLFTPRFLNL